MTKKLGLTGLATAAFILAACNAGTGAGSATASASASASAAASASGGGGSLYQISIGQTSLGSVLTGTDGKTLYLFTKRGDKFEKEALLPTLFVPMTGKAEWGKRCYQDEPDDTTWCGENVWDVYSQSQGVGLDGSKYKEW